MTTCRTTSPAISISATAQKVADAFAKAAHVTKLHLVNSRLVVSAMEPRAAIGDYDAQDRALDAARRLPGRVRPEGPARRHPRRAGRQGARAHRQCRRLVRHEGRGLSGIRRRPARLEAARPSGEMDRRPLRELPFRPSRPRPRVRRRTRARQGRQFPRLARHRLRQHGRVPRHRGAADGHHERRQEHDERLQDARDRSVDEVRVHQHDVRQRLSRRRPPRRQLLHGAADRPRRRGDGHRQGRSCAAAT